MAILRQMHTNAPKMLLRQNDNIWMFWLQSIKSKTLLSSLVNNVNFNNSSIPPEKVLINTKKKNCFFKYIEIILRKKLSFQPW